MFPSAAEGGKPYLSCAICGLIIESTVQDPKPDRRTKLPVRKGIPSNGPL